MPALGTFLSMTGRLYDARVSGLVISINISKSLYVGRVSTSKVSQPNDLLIAVGENMEGPTPKRGKEPEFRVYYSHVPSAC